MINEHMNLKTRIWINDITITLKGQKIIDFCNETKLIIMNIPTTKCKKNIVKKSSIEYSIVSESVLNISFELAIAIANISNKFEICPSVIHTDYSPMTIELPVHVDIASKEWTKILKQKPIWIRKQTAF